MALFIIFDVVMIGFIVHYKSLPAYEEISLDDGRESLAMPSKVIDLTESDNIVPLSE